MTKLQFDIEKETLADMRLLRDKLKSKSYAELVSKGLSLLKTLSSLKGNGYKITATKGTIVKELKEL